MSPEQAWGKPVDQRSDIYSLGAVLFEMATGRKLFQGDSDLNVLEKVRAGDVVLPSSLNPEVPPALDAAVLKALAREPDERYFNASDLLRDLDAVLRNLRAGSLERGPRDLRAAARSGGRWPGGWRGRARRSRRRRLSRRRRSRPSRSSGFRAHGRSAATPPPPPNRPLRPRRRSAAAVPGLTPQPPAGQPAPGRPRVPVPAGVFASFPEASADSEKKKRTRLYVLIAAAAVVLAVVGWLVVRKPAPSPPSAASVSPPPATPAVVESSITPLPTPPAVSVVDPKAAQEETQRQLAARRREMQKAAEAGAKELRPRREGASAGPCPVLRPRRPWPALRPRSRWPRRSPPRSSPRPRPPSSRLPPRLRALRRGARDRRGGRAGRPRRPGTRRRGTGLPVLSPDRVSSRRSQSGSQRQGRRAPARERARDGVGSEASAGNRRGSA